MGVKFSLFITVSIFWFIIYVIALIFTGKDWPECLAIGIVAFFILILLGALTGAYAGASLGFKSSHKKIIQNKISYVGGIIILWSILFLPILSYTTIKNIQYYY